MRRPSQIFHAISYVQYPLLLVAVVYFLQGAKAPMETRLDAYNSGLVFMGLSVSMSTLQDTTTTQNEVSRRVWSSPVLGKCFLWSLAATTVGLVVMGLWGMNQASDHKVHQLAFGLVVVGMGLVGLLKAAGEMFEHHRRDKRTPEPEGDGS